MPKVIEEVKGFYKIVELEQFRKTEGVMFDMIPMDLFERIDSIDRVIHKKNAISPSIEGINNRAWYMHKYQDDNLIVLHGTRFVDIYSTEYQERIRFEVSPDKVIKNGKVVYEGCAILVWPRYVFHRIISGELGSASINIAVHYEGFDIKHNFDIYLLDEKSGSYQLLREGYKDQT